MTAWKQIGLSVPVVALCVVVHVAMLGAGIEIVTSLGLSDWLGTGTRRWSSLVLVASGVVLLAHALQIGLWAAALRFLGALSNLEDAVYFALVTTTTLGYGDITLSPAFRLFGAMAAVVGLMTFGLSTAFLVGVTSGVLATTD